MDSSVSLAIPKGKELVQLMMKWEILEQEDLGGTVNKAVKVQCPNCAYSKTQLMKYGWTNFAQHYINCVGKDKKGELVHQKRRIEEENICSVVNESNGAIVQHLSPSNKSDALHFVVATDKQKSTHMWLKLVCLKNLPLSNIECPVYRHLSNSQR